MEPVELKFIISGNVDAEINKYIKSMKGVEVGAKEGGDKAKSYLSKAGADSAKGFSSGFKSAWNPAQLFNPTTLGISAVAGALLTIGKNAYQFSKDFNSAMLEVQTLSQATKADFDGISDSVLRVSKLPIKDTAVDLSKAYYQIVSAGYDGADGLKVLEVAAKAAAGGVTTTMAAADGLTTVLNAWGVSAEKVTEVSDQMFTAVRLGKTTMGELSANMAKAAPLAASLGVGYDQILAATASITKQGTPTAEAFTQMRAALTAMNGVLGDGWAKTMTFQDGLQKVRDMSGGSDVALKKLLGTDEAVLATLAMTGEKAAGAAADLDEMTKSAGASAEAFKTMSEDVDAKWQSVTNKWNANLADLGNTIKEMSAGLADFLGAALTMAGDEKIDENTNIEGFTDRMRMARNAGLSFVESLTAATLKGNKSINEYVDNAVKKGGEMLEKKNEDVERFQREMAAKTEGKDDVVTQQIIADEIEKYKGLIEQDKQLLTDLEGSKDAKDIRARINIKKDLPTFEAYIKELETMMQAGNTSLNMPVTPVIPNIQEQISELNKQIGEKKNELTTLRLPTSLATEADIVGAEKDLKDLQGRLETLTGKAGKKNEIELKFAAGSIAALEADLDKLQKKAGTLGDPKAEADLQKKIFAKQKEIDAEHLKVREQMYGQQEQLHKIEVAKTEEVTLQTKQTEAQLAPMRTLTDAEREQLELIQKQNEAEVDRYYLMQDMIDASYALGDVFRMAAGELEGIDEEISAIVGDMANIATGMGDMISQISEGGDGSMQYYTSLIGVMLTVSNQVKETKDNFWEKVFGKPDSRTDSVIKEMSDLFGATVVDLPGVFKDVWQAAFGDWENIGKDAVDDLAEYYSTMLGFTGDDLAGSVVSGLLEGFELANDGLGEWADNFQQIIEKAATQSLTKVFNEKYLNSLLAQFEKAMANDGVINAEEQAQLQADYANAVREMQKQAEAWSLVIGENADEMANGTEDESLKGDITRITQAQAGMLEGSITSMHFKLVELGDLQANMLKSLKNIEENTGQLHSIADYTDSMTKLQVINNELLRRISDRSAEGGFVL